eukprot:scaffold295721_cov31-Tisochrysis_lutea.AAC.1
MDPTRAEGEGKRHWLRGGFCGWEWWTAKEDKAVREESRRQWCPTQSGKRQHPVQAILLIANAKILWGSNKWEIQPEQSEATILSMCYCTCPYENLLMHTGRAMDYCPNPATNLRVLGKLAPALRQSMRPRRV